MHHRTKLPPGTEAKPRFAFLIALSALVLFIFQSAASVQADPRFTSLHEFSAPTPSRPIQATDGNFYGALYGGQLSGFGSIYKVASDGTETLLYQFTGGIDGANPAAALVEGSDGNLYGTTANGGTAGFGTIFKLTKAGALTTLHAFAAGEGRRPNSELIQGNDGTLYGVTPLGGAHGNGTVFKITTGGTFTTLHDFAAYDAGAYTNTEGAQPSAALAFGPDGNLYGTTIIGGSTQYGTIFQITTGGNFTMLHAFTGTDGYKPYSPLLLANGSLYGVTSAGGKNFLGNLFQVTTTGTVTSVCDFSQISTPKGAFFLSADGNFYGTAATDALGGQGSIFRVSGGTLTKVYVITNYAIGSNPNTGLIKGADGNFYGVTSFGGMYVGAGNLFKIVPPANSTTLGTASVVHAFTETGEIADVATVALNSDGRLFGTAYNDGTYTGSIYSLTTAGAFTNLHEFGLYSTPSPLLLASDGNFYGLTGNDGDYGDGTIYQLTPGGTFTLIHTFNNQSGHSEGFDAQGPLVESADGWLNGVCYRGGLENVGTAFLCSKTGDRFQDFWEFGTLSEGKYPNGPLTIGAGGSFYTTTHLGGTGGKGTVCVTTESGGFVSLFSFSTADGDGISPSAGLVRGTDGNFYGTTQTTVFKITPSGTLTTLYTFTGGADGTYPQATLLFAKDGNLYGTTTYGGIATVTNTSQPEGYGTIFKITTGGTLTTLYTFTGGSDGRGYTAPLVEGSNGVLYGAAAGAVIFRYDLNATGSTHPAFFNGEVPLSNGVYYLAFPNNGNIFGYYAYLSDPNYIYHFDLGFEYVFNANDGQSGVWFYDFTSSDFFYTSPNLPFPYLYDLNLQAFLYYYPDPTNPQRYNTNGVRYFYNFATGKIITK